MEEYDLKNFVYDEIIKECNRYNLLKRQIDYLSYVWLQWKNNPPRLDPNGEIAPTFEERINNEIKHRERLLSNASKFPVEPEVSLQKGGNKHEIILDSETSIRVGYDECEINDGVAPNKILASGIIEGHEFNTLSYVVINLI